ncbi:hypothetical protein [Vibrio phage JSF12]|uniref:Uncharacterized protein n=2 Tax=Jesfedecavirus TaxID=2560156 RepID=A0A2D0Z8M8_9CAUD|nr:hypothetical protein FDI98_gp034 [Vibrio phage JSF10]YP_009794765.1 hypothetical protein HOS35_gp082 [Vibrio phage JSF12]ASV43498.1 hypothetical protein [Vibrio phage JSF10]ASV43600.1 hypothetical protein [Vibrio phage JSF12]
MKNTRKLEVGQVRMIPDGEYPVHYVIVKLDERLGRLKVKILSAKDRDYMCWWDYSVTAHDVVVM